MRKTIVVASVLIACVAAAGLSLFAGYGWMQKEKEPGALAGYAANPAKRADAGTEAKSSPPAETAKPSGSPASSEPSPKPTATEAAQRVTKDAEMVYEYCYADGRVERTHAETPYFLVGKTEEDLKAEYPEWELIAFTPKQVVMRKDAEGAAADASKYIVGVQGGYVAVFAPSANGGAELKEMTGTPASALSEDDQQRLRRGVEVGSDDELAKILEDYGS